MEQTHPVNDPYRVIGMPLDERCRKLTDSLCRGLPDARGHEDTLQAIFDSFAKRLLDDRQFILNQFLVSDKTNEAT